MHLSPRGQTVSAALLLSLFLASNVAAQGLPKLPGSGDSATATSGGSAAASSQAASATSGSDKPSGTTTGKASGTSKGSSLPGLTTTSDTPGLTGLPKLAGDNYPPPSVPPTANAPFMQHSSLPEGTVFICVGAALGFIGVLVIAWRGLVAWSIHRSVKRAAIMHSNKYAHGRDPRSSHANTKSGAYFAANTASTLSLDHLAANGKGGNSKRASTAPSNLFFSPTAGAGMQTPANRGSGYLPAGYYAAGNQAPGMTHVGGGAVPMSNLSNQQGKRYSRASTPPGTPLRRSADSKAPDSPYNGRLSTQGLVNHASSSSLNVSAPSQVRAPSAYLEDLFENHPPGSQLPEGKTYSSTRFG